MRSLGNNIRFVPYRIICRRILKVVWTCVSYVRGRITKRVFKTKNARKEQETKAKGERA